MDLAKNLNISLVALLALQKDNWRKPNDSMWHHFARKFNKNVKIDLLSSFYVGDACGRPKGWKDKKTKKDFSCSDRKFAANVGVAFHSPEPFFLGERECENWSWLSLDPSEYLRENKGVIEEKESWFHGKLPIAKPNAFGLDMVIMRGPPASGKSSFCEKYLCSAGYVRINRDTLKTKAKCLKAAKEAMKSGKNVVIDNTNPDSAARAPYIEIAKANKANVRLFNMTTDRKVAEHCNLVRERVTKAKIKRISSMVYNIFYKKVREGEEPSVEKEGLNEIVDVDFVADFRGDEHREMWMQFT